MKIAYCATVQPSFGGLKTFNVGLVHALYSHCEANNISFILITHASHLGSFDMPENVKRSFTGNHFLFETLSLPGILKSEKVDWAIFPHNRTPLFSLGARKSAVIIHDLLFWRYPSQFSFLKWASRYFFMSVALKKVDSVFSVSEFTKHELEAFGYRSHVDVCLEGVESNSKEPDELYSGRNFPNDLPYFLFVGAHSFQKNLPALIEAFTLVRQSGYGCRLILAGGKGTDEDKVATYCNASPFSGDIIRPGFVTDSEKDWLMRHSVAFVFPSIYEGFGIPILEAFQKGTPVICSDCASLQEVAGENAVVVKSDPGSIAEGMLEVAKNNQLRTSLIEGGKKRLAQFTWKAVSALIMKKFV